MYCKPLCWGWICVDQYLKQALEKGALDSDVCRNNICMCS
jgi:hypothetical protein